MTHWTKWSVSCQKDWRWLLSGQILCADDRCCHFQCVFLFKISKKPCVLGNLA